MFETSNLSKVNDDSFDFTESIRSKCTSEDELYNTLNEQMYDAKMSPKKKKTVKFNLEVRDEIAPNKEAYVHTDIQNMFSNPDDGEPIAESENIDNNYNAIDDCGNRESFQFEMDVDADDYNEKSHEIIANQNKADDLSFKNAMSSSYLNAPPSHLTLNNFNQHPDTIINNLIHQNHQQQQQQQQQQLNHPGTQEISRVNNSEDLRPLNGIIKATKIVDGPEIFPKQFEAEIEPYHQINKDQDELKLHVHLKSLKNNFHKAKKALKLENKKKQTQIDNLTICIETQQKTLGNYEFMVSSLKYDLENLRLKHENILNENKRLNEKLDTTIYALEESRIQVDILNKVRELDANSALPDVNNINVSVHTNQNFEKMKSILEIVSVKNEYLQEVCMFLTKKINNMYRYTIAPALFLANETNPESVNGNLSFDSNSSVQTFIDSNMLIFQKLLDLPVTSDVSNLDSFKLEQNNVLTNLERFFDELNLKVASQLESIVRQRQFP